MQIYGVLRSLFTSFVPIGPEGEVTSLQDRDLSSGIPDILAVFHSNITIHNVITPSPPTIHNTATTKVPPGINITITPTIISTPNHTNAITPSPLVTVHSTVTTATVSSGTYYYNKYSLHDYYYFTPSHICTHSRPSCSQSPTQ